MIIQILINELPEHPTKRYRQRNLAKIDTIVVHHSGVETKLPRGGWLMTLRSIARYQVNTHGWPGLAYHYVIAPDGQVFKCQPVSALSYHAKGGNTSGIGICLLGNFEHTVPSRAQLTAAETLIAEIRRHMPHVTQVIGHRQVKGSRTACPGKFFTDDLIAGLAD